MTRRCCNNATCACRLESGVDVLGNDSIVVTGTGTSQDPFVVAFRGLQVTDTGDLDLSLVFTEGGGYALSAVFGTGSKLDSLGDVVAATPTNGQVLGWDAATSKWTPRAPTTAAAGSVLHDNSLTGDGSVGTPLASRYDAAGFLRTTTNGLSLTDAGITSLVRRFTDATARAAATPAPVLNSFSALDSAPGIIDGWTGTAWEPIIHLIGIEGDEYLAQSGSYDGRGVTLFVKQVAATTDTNGHFEVLSAADLTGIAGVLSVTVQPLGMTTAWTCHLDDAPTSNVVALAWDLLNSIPLAGASIMAVVTAYLY